MRPERDEGASPALSLGEYSYLMRTFADGERSVSSRFRPHQARGCTRRRFAQPRRFVG